MSAIAMQHPLRVREVSSDFHGCASGRKSRGVRLGQKQSNTIGYQFAKNARCALRRRCGARSASIGAMTPNEIAPPILRAACTGSEHRVERAEELEGEGGEGERNRGACGESRKRFERERLSRRCECERVREQERQRFDRCEEAERGCDAAHERMLLACEREEPEEDPEDVQMLRLIEQRGSNQPPALSTRLPQHAAL